MGRPTDDPKTVVKRARMSETDVEKLRICCQQLNMTESDVIRIGIDRVYIGLENKKKRVTPR